MYNFWEGYLGKLLAYMLRYPSNLGKECIGNGLHDKKSILLERPLDAV